jgi:alcohol dehydrogenase (cytochrome c)
MGGIAAGLMTGAAIAAEATPERLLNAGSDAEAANWLTVHRTYDSNRFTPLDEINASNVGNLKLAFAVPLGGLEPGSGGPGTMEGTPLAKDGFLYVTDPWGTPYKIDVSSGSQGTIVWVCDTGVEKDPGFVGTLANRGVALWGSLVVTALNDGRVVACDDDTGEVVWENQVATEVGEGFNNAPLAVKDKIIVGQSFGDLATRGWIAALNAETGEEVWRFFTVPEPGQPGSETWLCDQAGNPDCWKTGGAAAWQTGSYDPTNNTIYWGTANPVPMFDPEYRPGDNLYSNSTLALDADTGDLKWYFQYTPGDYLDYDEIGSQMLADVTVNGEPRKALVHFGRNGFFYTLDRSNGSFIQAKQYVDKLTWTEGIDPKTGQPIGYKAGAPLQEYTVGGAPRRDGRTIEACPDLQGGVNFWPAAYNPVTGIAYGAGIESCSEHATTGNDPADVHPGQVFLGGSIGRPNAAAGSVFAYNAATGEQIAKVGRPIANDAGVLATPSLVFTGEMDGNVVAFDAKTLEEKWKINLGTSFKAPPMSYAVDGKQYIAILGGAGGTPFGHEEYSNMKGTAMLFVFSL